MEHQETIKAAAKRMCEDLQAKGVNVKHTQMLEAIATGFGLDSWRELKAVIDAPRAKPAVVVPPLGEAQMWVVEALYAENNQQYGDELEARTPLEAAITAIIERLTDFGNEINILDVSDSSGKCRLSSSFITEIQLHGNKEALLMLYEAAKELPSLIAEHALLLRWLGAVLHKYAESELLADLTSWSDLQHSDERNSAPIGEGSVLTPAEALHVLCALVESHAGGVVVLEQNNEPLAIAVFQILAICDYFETLVNDKNVSPFIDVDFE